MKEKLIVCIGAALVDECFTCFEKPVTGTSNPARLHRSTGGVACNVASHLALLGHRVELMTHFGNDPDGMWLMNHCKANRVAINHSIINDLGSGKYVAMLDPEGDLFAGASVSHIEELITPGWLENNFTFLSDASLIVVDCNLSEESLNCILNFCKSRNILCIVEPVSIAKSARLRNCNLDGVLLITPNADEVRSVSVESKDSKINEHIAGILTRGVKNLWLREGKNGSKIFSKENTIELSAPDVNIKDITGAGDAALAGWIHAWMTDRNSTDCLKYGHAMASIILMTEGAVDKNLTENFLETVFKNYQ